MPPLFARFVVVLDFECRYDAALREEGNGPVLVGRRFEFRRWLVRFDTVPGFVVDGNDNDRRVRVVQIRPEQRTTPPSAPIAGVGIRRCKSTFDTLTGRVFDPPELARPTREDVDPFY